MPEKKQPLSALAFGADGRFRVSLSPADGAEQVAEVRDTTGELVFTAHRPGDVDPGFTGVLTDSSRSPSAATPSMSRMSSGSAGPARNPPFPQGRDP
jgi:hypothetical protein